MEVAELLARATDTLHVSRVYGSPIERDGILVIPAATVSGGVGGGGGTGTGPHGEGEGRGGGGGFGLRVRPAGAFVVRDGVVTWHPAPDAGRIVVAAAAVAIVAILAVRSHARRPRRAR